MVDQDDVLFLRHQWKILAHNFDRKIALHYRFASQGFQEIILNRIADAQYMLGMKRGYVPQGEWPAVLKHASYPDGAAVAIIWALGSQRETIRAACHGFIRLTRQCEAFTPVLLTDVADFSYYTRLGWLVEYLPNWDAKKHDYRTSKLTYLAWRYRDAMVIPLAAGLMSDDEWDGLRKMGKL